jgi:predicted nucleic acid-binding protein
MTGPIRYLADVSALVRLGEFEVGAVLGPLIQAGEVATCGVTELELLSRVRDPGTYQEVRRLLAAAFLRLGTIDEDFRRALEMQAQRVDSGQPPLSWPSLVVAANAERHQVTLLDPYSDFPAIQHHFGSGA